VERTAELQTAHEQLRQSQKLEAMGSLTGGVAHDFNNLLSPIVGVLDLLQTKGFGTERERRLIIGAARSAERAKLLVQRLLAFARKQPLQPVPVDLGKLVRDMAELVASTTGPNIKVVVDVEVGLPPANADPNQVEMALLNLSVNARDAMPNGGDLRIGASYRSGAIPGLEPGDYLCLSVADTGVGMDGTTLARAVEPFFSTKGVGNGTGLGLSMVHGLASQLGGALNIASEPGRGTTVELWLPRSEVSVTPATASGTSATTAFRGREYVRLSTATMLADLGFEILEAVSAEDALAVVEEEPGIGLVVTDHLMPGMTGVDLAMTLRERHSDLPVLVISGHADAATIEHELPRLWKPFRQAELVASLSALTLRSP
jgi:CheY-like chemotaxis protein